MTARAHGTTHGDVHDIYEDYGIPPCDVCGKSRAFCNCMFVGCACGEDHAKFEWPLYSDRTPECTPLAAALAIGL